MQYLLPCPCGQKLPVDASQAGLHVRCTCGTELHVPTLRDLKVLERASAGGSRTTGAGATGAQAGTWGPKQAVAFLGLSMVTVAVTAAAVLWLTYPKPPVYPRAVVEEYLNTLSVKELFEYSAKIRMGQPINESLPELNSFAMQNMACQTKATIYDRYLLGMAITAGVGVLLLLGSLVMKPKRDLERR